MFLISFFFFFTFGVVLHPHVIEVVEGGLQDPDAHHVVLAGGRQQPPAVGELHGPNGPLRRRRVKPLTH